MTEIEPYRVLGIDPGLTAMGLAGATGPDLVPVLICVRPRLRGHERLALLLAEVARCAAGCDLAVIEGLAYGAQGNSLLELAALQWMIRHTLWGLGIPYAVVSPPQVKQFATGHGNADKHDMVRAVYQRWDGAEAWGRVGPDEADALWLAAMGAQWLGQPVVDLPQAQAGVVHARWDGKTKGHKRGDPKITWPEPPPPPQGLLRPQDVVEAEIADGSAMGRHQGGCPGGACRCATVAADAMTRPMF